MQRVRMTAHSLYFKSHRSWLQEEVSALKAQLIKERNRSKETWCKNCDQLLEFDKSLDFNDNEIERLKLTIRRLTKGESHSESPQSHLDTPSPTPLRPRKENCPG